MLTKISCFSYPPTPNTPPLTPHLPGVPVVSMLRRYLIHKDNHDSRGNQGLVNTIAYHIQLSETSGFRPRLPTLVMMWPLVMLQK